jgi:hypothetical protein
MKIVNLTTSLNIVGSLGSSQNPIRSHDPRRNARRSQTTLKEIMFVGISRLTSRIAAKYPEERKDEYCLPSRYTGGQSRWKQHSKTVDSTIKENDAQTTQFILLSG